MFPYPLPNTFTSQQQQVRSEKPSVFVEEKQGPVYTGEGQTDIQTWEGVKVEHVADKKGTAFKLDTGKRAFEVNNYQKHTVQFPQTNIQVAGGEPFTARTDVLIEAEPKSKVEFTTGDGPAFRNVWNITANQALLSRGR